MQTKEAWPKSLKKEKTKDDWINAEPYIVFRENKRDIKNEKTGHKRARRGKKLLY